MPATKRSAKTAESSPPTKRQKINFSESITVHVGEEQKTYFVHKSLSTSSKFFEAAFSGTWKESTRNTVAIREFESEHFDHYAQWLYTGEVCLGADAGLLTWSSSVADFVDQYSMMIELYIMGYFLLDEAFRNFVIDAYLKTSDTLESYPGWESIQQLWHRVPEDAPLKKLVVNDWAHCVTAAEVLKQFHHLPPDFVKYLPPAIITVKDGDKQNEVPLPTYATVATIMSMTRMLRSARNASSTQFGVEASSGSA